ncbi:MAG: low-specificity L-threonine aldolase, partial [Acidimicrobiales bacterium]
IAAAGIHALDHHVARLADDHANAERLAHSLDCLEQLGVRQATNMVFVTTPAERHQGLIEHITARGILVGSDRPMRLVCHLDVGPDDVDRLADAFHSFFEARG